MKKEQLDEINKKLEDGIKKVMKSDEYQNWLSFCSKFHNYSMRNQMLIYTQKPDASYVAGFTKWKSLGRIVNKGEKGIMILSPAPYNKKVEKEKTELDGTEEDKEEYHRYLYFKPAFVFDVSQTSGCEIPKVEVPELQDQVKDFDDLKKIIETICPAKSIEIKKFDSKAKGHYIPAENIIEVQDGMSEAQTIKTMIHETAHACIDSPDSKYAIDPKSFDPVFFKELRAESIAYIVCDHFGIDTSDYSFKYLATWTPGGDEELAFLKENMKTINKVSNVMINKMEAEIEKYKEKEIGLEAGQNLDEKLEIAEVKGTERDGKEEEIER